ncbi:hypothetical protein [Ulvibacterium sp.]
MCVEAITANGPGDDLFLPPTTPNTYRDERKALLNVVQGLFF